MAVTNLSLDNVDEKFADMVKELHFLWKSGVKGGMNVMLSGNPLSFTYTYEKMDPAILKSIIIEGHKTGEIKA
jgi:hypothetical protein